MEELINRLRISRSRYGNPSMLEDKIGMIKGRMSAEKNIDFSDSEIERCLSPCVGGHFLVTLAKELRKQNLLMDKLCEECRQESAKWEAIENDKNENCK